MTLTRTLREELARRPVDPLLLSARETATALRFGGAWTWRHGAPGWTFSTSVASVARRVRGGLERCGGQTPALEAYRAGGLARAARWRLGVADPQALASLGLVDHAGRPIVPPLPDDASERVAVLRGALLAAAGLSAAGRPPHLEVRAPTEAAATALRVAVQALDVEAAATAHGDGGRVVVKSGDGIGRMLVRVGAHSTFLAFDEGRLRRQLRGEANRAANAERANLGRTVDAASRQAAAIATLLNEIAPEQLPEDLRETALARLANPGVRLAELARLLGRGRATVHRRLVRLEAMADEIEVARQ